MRIVAGSLLALTVFLGSIVAAHSKNFPYNRNVTLKVGQSIILKGVRGGCNDRRAPSFRRLKDRLPRSRTGAFSDGGAGTVDSNRCGGEVPARGIKFKANRKGSEKLNIYDDVISITVK